MPDARSINRVRFIGFDYRTILDELRTTAVSSFGAVANDLNADMGAKILQHFSYAFDALTYYMDRRASDGFTNTARQRTSMTLLTRQLGYNFSSAVASSVDLRIALTQSYTFNITFPAGYRFVSVNGLIFEVTEETIFPPGETIKTVPVYEGITTSETFVSNGEANQRVSLRQVPDDKFPVAGLVQVLVDGNPWVENDIITYDKTDQFESEFTADPPAVVFGDGNAGNIPALGAEVIVTYLACSGVKGNVGAGTITAAKNALIVNFEKIPFLVTNVEGSVGGDDPETISHARIFAGQVWKSRYVAVTGEDYAALAGSFADPTAGRVAVAKALSSKRASQDLTLENALRTIEALAIEPVPQVTASLTSVRTGLNDVESELLIIDSEQSEVDTLIALIDSYLVSTITSARQSKNSTVDIEVDANDIKDNVSDATLYLDNLTVGATLTQQMIDDLQGYYDRIDNEASEIIQSIVSLRGTLDGQISAMGQSRNTIEDLGARETADTHLYNIEQARLSSVDTIGDEEDPTGIYSDLADIEAAVIDYSADIHKETSLIRAHVDSFLSADCKANLVTVAILAKNSGGFYAEPSTRLMRTLQDYLNGRKSVSQVISVTSGAKFLVPAVIDVRLGIASNFSDSVIRTQVNIALESVLRNRAFGASLYLDELYEVLRGISGILYRNLTITGSYDSQGVLDASKVDVDGNLIVVTTEVVTFGYIGISIKYPDKNDS